MTAKEAEEMKEEAKKLTLGKWSVRFLNGRDKELMLMEDVMEIIDKHTASPTGAESEDKDGNK